MDEHADKTPQAPVLENGILRALIIEDSENDTLLLVDYIENSGFQLDWLRVDTESALLEALTLKWDIVFSDYSMPRFSGSRALTLLKNHDADIPFIFVSGTIGEVTAVESIKAGAQDYVIKGNLLRLVPTIRRELNDVSLRRERRESEQTLRKLSLVVEQATDSVFITDAAGKIQYVNPAFEKLTGYSAAETVGHTPALVKSDKHDSVFYQRMWETILAGKTFQETVINCRKDGTPFYEEKVITPLFDAANCISHFVSTGRDITERIHVEEARAQLLTILETATDFVAIMDNSGQLQYLNHAGRLLLGLADGDDITSKGVVDCCPQWAAHRIQTEAFPMARHKGVWHGESAVWGKAGEEIPVSQVVVTHSGEDGKLKFFSTIARDITERKKFESELQRQATHDALTGLPNRLLLQDHLARELARSDRDHSLVAVLFLDVDNFKRINDSLGHAAGDMLLCSVAQRLRSYLRPSDLVARYGGDEFTILVSGISSVDDVAIVAYKLREAFSTPFPVPGQDVYVTFSTGISVYPSDGKDPETLLKNADAAMYRAKVIGRNQHQFYAPEMNARGQELLALETDLRRALERNEFVLYYQPQMALHSGRVVGLEALIRWQHPVHGLIAPADFVPMLEETGLIVPVGAWVLREACAHYRRCREAGQAPVRISVNVSARQFMDRALVQMVRETLQKDSVPPQHLELEITESTVMQDVQTAGEILNALDVLGVRLAIDDFGTGYSSLAYLKRFPLDVLKIDQVFVQDLATDANVMAIVEASISLGHKLGLEVVAEGVETQEQMVFLRDHGCDMIQGYYLSRPMPAENAMRFVAGYSDPVD